VVHLDIGTQGSGCEMDGALIVSGIGPLNSVTAHLVVKTGATGIEAEQR
jgi:hypothetical protein